MKIVRRKAKIIKIGNIYIGGNHPIAIQSMAKTKTACVDETLRQIKELKDAGCEIVRLAIKDSSDAKALKRIKQAIDTPVVTDIHFDWRLALESIDNGADKIRLNPGNIYKINQIREIVSSLKSAKIPLRIGVNSGSVRGLNSKKLSMPEKLVASALGYIKIIEKLKFYDIVISLKASNIFDTIEAYRKIAKLCDYPLHLGVTATGLPQEGAVKSSIALGALLLEGIGDTIRISLTDEPKEEVKVAKYLLACLGLRQFGPEIISCPTCGRCEVDLIKIVKELEKKITQSTMSSSPQTTDINCRLSTLDCRLPLKVAVMGCIVNGPGEAKEADLGVAFGKKEGLLFKKGRPIRKVSFQNSVETLLKEIRTVN